MLSRERTAITQDQIGGALDEFGKLANARFTEQIEAHLHVDATMPKMTVEAGLVTELVEKLSEVAKIGAQLFGGHRGVIPPFPQQRCSGHELRAAWSSLTDLPDGFGFALAIKPHVGRARPPAKTFHHQASAAFCFTRVV